jgi:hypothetical protein
MKRTVDKKSHCHHRTACGRRCRKPISAPESRFCDLHQAVADAQPEPDLSAALMGGLDKFSSPDAINEFLSRLLVLLSENRISPRRAAVLAFITSQILRTISVMEAVAQARKKLPPGFLWQLESPQPEPRKMEPSTLPQPATCQSGGAASPGATTSA